MVVGCREDAGHHGQKRVSLRTQLGARLEAAYAEHLIKGLFPNVTCVGLCPEPHNWPLSANRVWTAVRLCYWSRFCALWRSVQ